MPSVTVLPRPNGLPIASTTSPTCRLSDAANVIAGRSVRVRLQHGEIGLGIGAAHARRHAAAVGEHELDVVGALDHVVIGDHVALGRHDDARAEARLPLRRAAVEIGEVAAEQRVVGERIARAHFLARVDVDDRRHRLLRGVRVARDARAADGRRRFLRDDDVARAARSARQQVRTQRGDDEQRREAQRAGLREQEPEFAEHCAKV